MLFVPLESEKQGQASILMLFSRPGSTLGAEGPPETWASLSNAHNLLNEGLLRGFLGPISKALSLLKQLEKAVSTQRE